MLTHVGFAGGVTSSVEVRRPEPIAATRPVTFGQVGDNQKIALLRVFAEETLPAQTLAVKNRTRDYRRGQNPPQGPLVQQARYADGKPAPEQLILTTAEGATYRLTGIPEGVTESFPDVEKRIKRFSHYRIERLYPETSGLRGRIRKFLNPADFPPMDVTAHTYSIFRQQWIMPVHNPRQTARWGPETYLTSGFHLTGVTPQTGPFEWREGEEKIQLAHKMQVCLAELFKAGKELIEAQAKFERTRTPEDKITL